MKRDEVISAVRKAREKQAARWNFDLKAVLTDARKRQTESKRQVVSFVAKSSKTR